jgi:hypothetical protein
MSNKSKVSISFIQDLLKKFMTHKIDTTDFTAEVNKEILLINLSADDIAVVKALEKKNNFLKNKLKLKKEEVRRLNKIKFKPRAKKAEEGIAIEVYNTSNEKILEYATPMLAANDLGFRRATVVKAIDSRENVVYCKKLDKNIYFKWV